MGTAGGGLSSRSLRLGSCTLDCSVSDRLSSVGRYSSPELCLCVGESWTAAIPSVADICSRSGDEDDEGIKNLAVGVTGEGVYRLVESDCAD